jgi:16S rRNA (cytosine1402-N4)-methyltransferase
MERHLPVMVREVLSTLNLKPRGTYVDATIGTGGHALEILGRLDHDGRLIGIDRDEEALKISRMKVADDRVLLINGRLAEMKALLNDAGVTEVDGILFDFGVSMAQLMDGARGFGFTSGAPLDMRMDRSQGLKADDVVNRYPEEELERILREYGEERFAAKIARTIVARRKKKRIGSCEELAEIVSRVYGRRGRIHPATRTFQALRIEVNDEIHEIACGLAASAGLLRRTGRLCALSYHSLEDRLVKQWMRDGKKKGLLEIITKKPLRPSVEEILSNPSSRSAKLRGAERI